MYTTQFLFSFLQNHYRVPLNKVKERYLWVGLKFGLLFLLCLFQLKLPLRDIKDQCDLYDESGKMTDTNTDRRIDFHFNAMLDNVAEWRQKNHGKDVHLLGNAIYYFNPPPP